MLKSRIQFLLIGLLATMQSLHAAEFVLASGSAGLTKWQVTAPYNGMPSVGMIPLTITATNNGGKTINANYDFTSLTRGYGGTNARLASGLLTLVPGKPMTATHWVWRGSEVRNSYNYGYTRFAISAGNASSENTLTTGDRSGTQVAVSSALDVASNLQVDLNSRKGNYSSGDKAEIVLTAPESLPADWRVFSSLHAVFLLSSDWDLLSPGVRDALRTWIGFGGTVRVFSRQISDAERVVAEIVPDRSVLGVFANAAAVKAVPLGRAESEMNTFMNPTKIVYGVGAPDEDRYRNRNRSSRRYRNYDNKFGRNGRQKFPLRDDFGRRDIPYFFICMLLVIFAVLVGPVSLKLWAGAGRRHRLFFTTPALSLAASGLLLLLMLFQDGLGLDGRRFVILDLAPVGSSQPNALVYQEQFSRAGMIGGGGFPLESGLIPIVSNSAVDESLSWRDGRAVGDWFSSRRDRSLVLAGSVPVRWNVSHEGATEDSLTLRIESPVSDFEEAWFIDGEGVVWKWDNNKADADGQIKFIPAGRDPSSILGSMFDRCSQNLKEFVLNRMEQDNQRNRFWALVEDGSAAARPTNPKIDWRESNLILTSKVTPK